MFYLPEERGAWCRVSLQHAHPTPYTLLIALVKLCSERDIKDYTFNDSVAVWPHNGKGTSRALTILFLCSFWPLGLPALDEENNTQHPLSTHWAPTEHPPAPAYIPTCTTQVFIQKNNSEYTGTLQHYSKTILDENTPGAFLGTSSVTYSVVSNGVSWLESDKLDFLLLSSDIFFRQVVAGGLGSPFSGFGMLREREAGAVHKYRMHQLPPKGTVKGLEELHILEWKFLPKKVEENKLNSRKTRTKNHEN